MYIFSRFSEKLLKQGVEWLMKTLKAHPWICCICIILCVTQFENHPCRPWEWAEVSVVQMGTYESQGTPLLKNLTLHISHSFKKHTSLMKCSQHKTENNICIARWPTFYDLNLALPGCLNVSPASSSSRMFVNSRHSHRYTPCDVYTFNSGRRSGDRSSLQV